MTYSELTTEEAVALMVATFGGSLSQMYERLVARDYVLCKRITPPRAWQQTPYPIAFLGCSNERTDQWEMNNTDRGKGWRARR